MLNRIRFAMADSAVPPLTGIVEADETYIGGKPRHRSNKPGPRGTKPAVMAMVQRGGSVKTRIVANVGAKTVKQVILENVDPSARLMTDEHASYIRR